MRKFQFGVEVERKGKRLARERNRLGRQIRREIKRSLGRVNPSKIRALRSQDLLERPRASRSLTIILTISQSLRAFRRAVSREEGE